MSHDALVARALRWLTNTKKCWVATGEPVAGTAGEQPDAMGWRGMTSHLVECKTSRSDFHRDRRKFFRAYPDKGMGEFRWYLTPAGLLEPSDLPAHWGLLEARKRVIKVVVVAVRQESDLQRERMLLAGQLRKGRTEAAHRLERWLARTPLGQAVDP